MSTTSSSTPTWTTEPVYDDYGQRICALDGCTDKHSGRGLCKVHYRRWRINGDPHRASRFDTQEEKAAFIAADIAARKQRRAREREHHEAERERQRLLRPRSLGKIRPEAKALVAALDAMPEAERAAVASAVVGLLLGQTVEDLTARIHETYPADDATEE